MAADRLPGSLATEAEAHGEAGLDPITQDSLTAPANDIFGFAGADLAVLPAPTQPLPVATDARGLTSTAERALRCDGRPVVPALPPLLDAGPGGTFVRDDPGSDAIRVCVGQPGGGDLVPPVIAAGEPQAGLAAPGRAERAR